MQTSEIPPMYVSRAQTNGRLKSGAYLVGGPDFRTSLGHRTARMDDFQISESELPLGFEPGAPDMEKKFPHLSAFEVRHFLIVEAGLAQVLKSQDLGRTTLHPVEYFDNGHGYCQGKKFFFVNLSEVRSFIVPLKAYEFEANASTGRVMRSPYPLTNGPLPVVYAGEQLPAMWREKTMPGSLFFSKACGDALISAGYGEAFDLMPCRYATTDDVSKALR